MSLNKKLMGHMPEWNVGTFTGLIDVGAGAVVDLMASIEADRVAQGLEAKPINYVRLTADSADVFIGDFRSLDAGGDGFPILSMSGGLAGSLTNAFDMQVGNGRPALTAVGAREVFFIAYTEK
jgi:hypothetical protein